MRDTLVLQGPPPLPSCPFLEGLGPRQGELQIDGRRIEGEPLIIHHEHDSLRPMGRDTWPGMETPAVPGFCDK